EGRRQRRHRGDGVRPDRAERERRVLADGGGRTLERFDQVGDGLCGGGAKLAEADGGSRLVARVRVAEHGGKFGRRLAGGDGFRATASHKENGKGEESSSFQPRRGGSR